jgi:hypothetical protein
MHGDEGAGNSKARRKVLEGEIFGIVSRRVVEEIRVKKLVVQKEAGIMN